MDRARTTDRINFTAWSPIGHPLAKLMPLSSTQWYGHPGGKPWGNFPAKRGATRPDSSGDTIGNGEGRGRGGDVMSNRPLSPFGSSHRMATRPTRRDRRGVRHQRQRLAQHRERPRAHRAQRPSRPPTKATPGWGRVLSAWWSASRRAARGVWSRRAITRASGRSTRRTVRARCGATGDRKRPLVDLVMLLSRIRAPGLRRGRG